MSFMVYLAVFIATVFSIALEWGTIVERPQVAYHAEQVQAPVLPAAPVAREATPDNPSANNAASVPAAPPPAQPSVACDVDACAAAYRSFRASDCTYMPNAGVRRLCTKGQPPQ
jgi:hypothetical protein